MKNIFRRLFRYGFADYYMVLSGIIALTSVLLILSLYNAIWDSRSDERRYASKSEYTFLVEWSDRELNLSDLKLAQGNVMLREGMIALEGKGQSVAALGTVFLSSNEKLPAYPVRGAMPEKQEKNRIVLGKGYQDFFHVKEGDTIRVYGEDTLITGIVASEKSDYFDDCIMLYYDSLSEQGQGQLRDYLEMEGSVLVSISSQSLDTGIIYEKALPVLQEKGYRTVPVSVKEEKEPPGLKLTAYVLMYLFALIQCVLSAELWSFVRKKEIRVRYTFGMKESRITAHVFYELLRQMMLSMVLGLLIIKAYTFVTGNAIVVHFNMLNILFVFGSILLTAMATLLGSIWSMRRHAMLRG